MSFGKDDSNLSRIGTYGATSTQQMGNAAKRQSGPRKGPPPWANNYEPSEGTPDTIRLIPGDFEAERIDKNSGQSFKEQVPWFEYTEHFHGGIKKGTICSGGVYRMSDKKRAQPCRGCDIWREDANERRRIEAEKGVKPQQPNRVSFSSKYAFITLDTGWFFKAYRYDEHGRVKVGSNNQPFMDWVKYGDTTYNIYQATQRDLAQQGKAIETQQGLIRPWPMNYTQFNTFIGFAEMIQKHCKNCGGMNCIHTQGWVCPHCSAPTLQMNETTMPADKIKEIVNGITMCRNCKQQGYPRAVQQCQHCSNPSPSSLYDVDLHVQTIKVPTSKTKQLHLAGTSAPKPIDGVFSELLKKLPDLERKFAPTPYDEQVALFGPAAAQMDAPQQHFQQPQYGQPQGAQGGFQAPPAFGSYSQQPQQPPQAGYYQQQPYQPAQPWGNGSGGWNNGGNGGNGGNVPY